MAISFGSNLVHGSAQKGLVDSDQVFGSFKTHVGSLADFRNFVDDYTDNGNDYFNLDLWGKFKPYATLVYVSNGNALNVLNDVSNLSLENGDYFVGVDSDGNSINIAIDAADAAPKVFMYTGNGNYATTQSYDSNVTNRFTVSGNKATPMAWTDFSEYVGGTGSDLSGLSINTGFFDGTADLPDGVDEATTLSHIGLGEVSGNGTDGFTIEFPTNNDIRTAFSNSTITTAQVGDINFVDNADGTMHIRVAPNAALGVASVAATGNASIGGTLSVTGNTTLGTLSAVNTTFTGSITASSVSGDADGNVMLVSTAGVVSSDTAANVFTDLYSSVTETVAGTANEILVDNAVAADSGNITLSLADTLILSPGNGGVTIGTSGNDAQILTAYGDATINGNLTVTGDFVQTTSQTVTFTDNLLSLNISRDGSNNIPANVGIGGIGADAGIEAFHGATTETPTAGGPAVHHVDNGRHSRPYIKYQYGAGNAIDNNAGLNWGKWKLANYYLNPDVSADDTVAKQFEGSDWTVQEGTILTDLDTSITSLADLHTGSANALTSLVTPSRLLSIYTVNATGDSVYTESAPSGQEYGRNFGRVATNTVTYGAGSGTAPVDAAIEVTHGLNTDEVIAMAVVVQRGSGSGLPAIGEVVTPQSKKGTTVNSRKVKVQGVVASDILKFVFIG